MESGEFSVQTVADRESMAVFTRRRYTESKQCFRRASSHILDW